MISVAVGVENRGYGAHPKMFVGEFKAGSRCHPGREWIDDNPAVFPLDKSDVRKVVTAALPDASSNFKQSMYCIQAAVSPQAWMHRVWSIFLITKKIKVSSIPCKSHRAFDSTGRVFSDFATGGTFPVSGIIERQCAARACVHVDSEL